VGFTSSSRNTLANTNCSDNNVGVQLYLSDNNTLGNNDCSSNAYVGILLTSSSDNTLSSNTCSNNACGIRLTSSSNNTIIWNQICNSTSYGVYVDSGSNNRVWNNTFINNNGAGSTYDSGHVQAYDDRTNNWWNTSGTPHGYGNYWSDWTTPDANHDGIVDNPYVLDGSAVAKDNYPQTTKPQVPIPEFGVMPFVMIALMAVIVLAGESRQRKKS
jgi:parallel beta-helix repeat protein